MKINKKLYKKKRMGHLNNDSNGRDRNNENADNDYVNADDKPSVLGGRGGETIICTNAKKVVIRKHIYMCVCILYTLCSLCFRPLLLTRITYSHGAINKSFFVFFFSF